MTKRLEVPGKTTLTPLNVPFARKILTFPDVNIIVATVAGYFAGNAATTRWLSPAQPNRYGECEMFLVNI